MANLLAFGAIFLVPTSVLSLSPHPKLLLISMDGFRHDLLNITMVPTIYQWANKGARFVNGMMPQYISLTVPNHMGLVTGLNAESHGIISNQFYEILDDGKTRYLYDYYNFSSTEGIIERSLDDRWYFGEPIWSTNEKADHTRHSACLHWPAGDANIPNAEKPTFFTRWNDYQTPDTWRNDVDTIMYLFTRTHQPVNFLAWYIDEPDHTLHINGFHNGELPKTLHKLDKMFDYLLKKMKEHHLHNKVNVILTADHGHAQINGTKSMLCVKDYVDLNKVFYGDKMIYASDQATIEEAYRNLTSAVSKYGFKVNIYRKESFPGHYFYTGKPSRIGEIILEAEVGYEVDFKCTREQLNRDYDNVNKEYHNSTHGQSPNSREMRQFLIINGPSIAPQQVIHEVPQVTDVYSLMCNLLGVTAAPNNGSLKRISKNLHFTSDPHQLIHGLTVVALPVLAIVVVVLACFLVRFIAYKTDSEHFTERDGRSSEESV